MKKLIYNKLSSIKGETLIETIVSTIMFSVFIFVISSMITISLNITNITTQTATDIQENFLNPVIRRLNYNETGAITFFNTNGISATHDVIINNKDSIIAFFPEEVDVP